MIALLADVGGTKTQVALVDPDGIFLHEMRVLNSTHENFEHLIETFFQSTNMRPTHAVIAVAGPVDNAIHCQMTNLPWIIDGLSLQRRLNLQDIVVLNDLQATAWGMTTPEVQSKLEMIRGDRLNFDHPVIVISPGTGLGQTCIIPHPAGYLIQATEGGHKSIAPFNALSAQLLQQHWQQHQYPPSWENWFSGSGLGNLYQAMFPDTAIPDNQSLGKQAMQDPESTSGQCIKLFTQAIYAESGNLVLQYLAWGGIIIAGGIPPQLKTFFTARENIEYIHKKNEYLDRLQQVPVALCLETNSPLTGAAAYFRRFMQP